jgi:pyruvate dehydrogenase E1 component alpha subunit
MGHSRFENPSYRTKEELESWKLRDPITGFAHVLASMFGVDRDELEAIDCTVAEEIEHAVAYAEQSADTEARDYEQYVYA